MTTIQLIEQAIWQDLSLTKEQALALVEMVRAGYRAVTL